MILVKGNVFEYPNLDYVCITTNSILNTKGELVMGAGIALEAKKRFPQLPKIYGNKIDKLGLFGKDYYLLQHINLIAFQTKRHYEDKSPIELVKRSTQRLKFLATLFDDSIFGLPFPAVQNGGLSKDVVLPIINCLPNNVIVFEKE